MAHTTSGYYRDRLGFEPESEPLRRHHGTATAAAAEKHLRKTTAATATEERMSSSSTVQQQRHHSSSSTAVHSSTSRSTSRQVTSVQQQSSSSSKYEGGTSSVQQQHHSSQLVSSSSSYQDGATNGAYGLTHHGSRSHGTSGTVMTGHGSHGVYEENLNKFKGTAEREKKWCFFRVWATGVRERFLPPPARSLSSSPPKCTAVVT